MRVDIVVLAALLASCDAISTTESGRTKVSLMIATDNTQPAGAVENGITSKRFLRTAKTLNDGEERGGLAALKSLLPGTKILAEDGQNFSGYFVEKMLKKKAFRKKVFLSWGRGGDIDGAAFRQALGDMNEKGRAELLNRFTASLGPQHGLVYHRPGPVV